MRKQTKHYLIHFIQVICAISFFAGFMIVGAAIDSCDYGSISITHSIIVTGFGFLCSGLGAFLFSILDKYS